LACRWISSSPCGFLWDDKRLRRAGMDYLAGAEILRHESWKISNASAAGAFCC
jgi:tRNA (cytidine/uridine-2'-O-)-methyltransferase